MQDTKRDHLQILKLGDIIREWLDKARCMPHKRTLLNAVQLMLLGGAIGIRTKVLLCWLWHIAAILKNLPATQAVG